MRKLLYTILLTMTGCGASQMSPEQNRCMLNADAAYQLGVMQHCKAYDTLGECEKEKELFENLKKEYEKCLRQ